LYWHGSSASRMLRHQRAGISVCVTVSHIDGLILARCAFRHSMNYRAVLAFGTTAMVDDPAEKEAGLNALIERLYPGRTRVMRGIAQQEQKATMLMSLLIETASAKIRDGGPLNLESDYDAECWAGTIPIAPRTGAPFDGPHLRPGITAAPEIGPFIKGAAFDEALLALARRHGSEP